MKRGDSGWGGGTCALLKKCVNFFNLFLKM